MRYRNGLFLLAPVAILLQSSGVWGGTWSDQVDVWRGPTRCVSYRARLDGDLLVVEARHEPNWHTYAMDNPQRAATKLAGKQSLGIEQPTSIDLGAGLQPIGPWFQSPPRDFSKPELRWFTWGFEKTAQFAVQVKPTGKSKTQISVRGQACDSKSCQNISVKIELPVTDGELAAERKIDLRNLIRVTAKAKNEGP